MKDQWLRCIPCNEVVHFTEYDRASYYQKDEVTGEVKEVAENDREQFLVQHRGHNLEELTVVKGSFIGEGRYGEPMRESYGEASNGKERFVIRRWRDNIHSPLRYELIPGSLVTTVRVEVQSNEIRKQMRAELTCPPLSEAQIERFIKIVEQAAAQFPLRVDQGITVESNTPRFAYCRMSNSAIKQILNLSRRVFNPAEMVQVERFIHRNSHYSDPMTLLVTREFSLRKAKRKAEGLEKEPLLFSEKGDVVQRNPR